MTNNHTQIKFGDFEDCYSAYIPKKHKQSHSNQLEDVYEKTCIHIDDISNSVLANKFKKLSAQLLNWIQEEIFNQAYLTYELRNRDNQYNTTIQYAFLSVDQANRSCINDFYRKLNMDRANHQHLKEESLKLGYEDGEVLSTIKIVQYDKLYISTANNNLEQLSYLLNFILETLRHQYRAKADAHCTVFLLQNVYNLPIEQLADLRKTLSEEIECKGYCSVLIIMPASEQMVANYESNGLLSRSYLFSDPRKMIIELIIRLIKNVRVPMLHQSLYVKLQNDFTTYITSYQSQVTKIKTAYYLYFSQKCNHITQFLHTYDDQPSKDVLYVDYLKQRHQLSQCIDGFQIFIKELKRQGNLQIRNFKGRVLNLICASQNSTFFQLPQNADVEQAIELFLNMNIQDQQVRKFLQSAEIQIQIGNSQKTQQKDRILQLLQKPDSKKDRYEDQVNSFLNLFILDTMKKLKNMCGQYIFDDLKLFNDMTQPDIMEKYHTTLMNCKLPHTKATQILYTAFARKGQQVPASEVYDDDPQQFFYSISELKLLGLIEDTKKTKLTYSKDYFAKQQFANYFGE